MASFRDIKRKARRDLHSVMRVPALYIATPTDDPVPVFVRVHQSFNALGDVKGTNLSYAERQEITPRIVLMRDEVDAPVRDAVISVEAGEAYRIDHVLPADDISVTVEVIKMKTSETTGLPLPEAL